MRSLLNSEDGVMESRRGGFAIVDVETTGFSARTDRIVEIGLVLADSDGEAYDSWTCRFNPEGPVGPTHIHGITDADVANAPLFADTISDLVALLRGNAFVAHNANFDIAFLRAEFERAGWDFPRVPVFCTMDESWYFLPNLQQHKLADCCMEIGITQEQQHSAIHDAEATAKILRYFLDPRLQPTVRPEHNGLTTAAMSVEWSNGPCRDRIVQEPRSGGPQQNWRNWKKRGQSSPLIKTLDAFALASAIDAGSPTNSKAYLALLLEVLEDGVITANEGFTLADLAQMYDLSKDEISAAHRGFLTALAHEALADETVSREEREELKHTARLLDMPESMVTDVVNVARAIRIAHRSDELIPVELPENWLLGEPLRVGDRVAFTGGDQAQRDELEACAKELGVRVMSSVSGKTTMLITDGEFSGTKASAARANGTRLVHPDEFRILLDYIQPSLVIDKDR